MESITCSKCGSQNRAGVKFCTRCGSALAASPAPAAAVAPPAPVPSSAPAQTVVSHVEGQAVIIGDNARQQISYYGDIIVRVDSLEELPPQEGQPPYKGLTYYTEADEAIFFGREQLSDDLAARLTATPFLAVAGASGSGKSSLLRAGVVPRLRRRNWLAHVLTPTADPLTQLAATLTRDDPSLSAADELRAGLAADPQTLRRKAGQLVARAGAARLLLVVDQFEELFTQCHDEAGRRAFIDNLLAAARNGSNVTVLIGLRADFTGRLTEVEELRALVEQNFALLGPMQQADLVRVILEPARLGGWGFVSGLVEQFLSDVGQEPGRLPLLSHALLETWARRSSHVMTLKGYRAAGGVEGAIARTAEDTLRRLDEQTEQPVMQAVFLALTELGEGSEDTRRIARRDELARAGDAAAVAAVLDTLAAARLVTVDADSVQVAHEALIRRWPRLREWLADNRERLRFERQLEADALEWEQLQRDLGALYRGARLVQAQEWRKAGRRLSPRVEAFLAASAVEAEQEVRQAKQLERAGLVRRFAYALGALAGIALIAAVVAGLFAVVARNAQVQVEVLNVELRSRRLASEAERYLTSDPERSLLLAAAAYQSINPRDGSTTGEARGALYHALDTDAYWRTLDSHNEFVDTARFSPDGTRVLTVVGLRATESGSVNTAVWDVLTGQVLFETDLFDGAEMGDFDPTGSLIVTAGFDGVQISDAKTGRRLHELTEDYSPFAAFSPDGSQLATTHTDGSVRTWDVESGRPLPSLFGHRDIVRLLVYSMDGSRLASASDDRTIRLWDPITGQFERELVGHTESIRTVAFSPDGEEILSAGGDAARLWDVSNGRPLWEFEHNAPITAAAYSQDGKLVLTADEDGLAKVWDAASGELLSELIGHSGRINSAVFSPDGKLAVTAGEDHTVHIWNTVNRKLVRVLTGHTDSVVNAEFSEDGEWLATVSRDGTTRLLQVSYAFMGSKFLVEVPGGGQASLLYEGFESQFSSNGRHLLTIDLLGGTVRVIDVATGEVIFEFPGLFTARYSADGNRVVTVGDKVQVWDASSGTLVDEPETPPLGSELLVTLLSSDGTQGISIGDEEVVVWDISSGEVMGRINVRVEGGLGTVRLGPNGEQLVAYTTDGSVGIWDVASGELLTEVIPYDTDNEYILVSLFTVFSPDGTRMMIIGEDGEVSLMETSSGETIAKLEGHSALINYVAFSPDGSTIVTVSDDRTARLWDATSGAARVKLIGHTGSVFSASFAPGSERVITVSADDTARIWDVSDGAVLAELDGVDPLSSMSFSANGDTVATVDGGSIHIWDSASGELLTELLADIPFAATFSPDSSRVLVAESLTSDSLWSVLPLDEMLGEAQRRLRREPTAIIPDFCVRYFQDAPDDCPDTLTKLFPEGD